MNFTVKRTTRPGSAFDETYSINCDVPGRIHEVGNGRCNRGEAIKVLFFLFGIRYPELTQHGIYHEIDWAMRTATERYRSDVYRNHEDFQGWIEDDDPSPEDMGMVYR